MAKYYFEVCQRYKGHGRQKMEQVDYNIDRLIQLEAESWAECNLDLDEVSDEEFDQQVQKKEKEIWDALKNTGIYKNEIGLPMFMMVEM